MSKPLECTDKNAQFLTVKPNGPAATLVEGHTTLPKAEPFRIFMRVDYLIATLERIHAAGPESSATLDLLIEQLSASKS